MKAKSLDKAKEKLAAAMIEFYETGTIEREKNWFERTFQINCPVAITVYDANNNVLGCVSDEEFWYDDSIMIVEKGGAKKIYAGNQEIRLEISGTDTGTMNCSFEQLENGVATGRVNYYEVPVSVDNPYTATISSNAIQGKEQIRMENGAALTVAADEYIPAQADARVTVTVSSNAGDFGKIVGAGQYARGDVVVLHAIPMESWEFVGWFDEDDMLLSAMANYDFTAKEDVSLKAVFADPRTQELAILDQPAAIEAEAGESVTLTTEATGYNLTYQWQYRENAEAEWTDFAEATGSDFTAVIAPEWDGWEIRCVVTDGSEESVSTEPVEVTILIPLEILSQPQSVEDVAGASITFAVDAVGKNVQYQWQYRKTSDSAWKNFRTGTEAELSKVLIPMWNGWEVRCVITDVFGEQLITDTVTITVIDQAQEDLSIKTQPKDITAAAGETVSFSIEAAGEGVSYQWQYCRRGETQWNDAEEASAQSAALAIRVTAERNGQSFRCRITDVNGSTLVTESATLTVKTPVQTNPFTDVPEGKFYHDPVLWAISQDPQITTGVTDTTFMPDRVCTRAHVVTFLWRANGCPEPTSMTNTFKDVPNGKYYTKAVLWAAEQGITTGYSDGTFRPNDECTRGQVVTFLWRAKGQPAPTSTSNPFSDVPAGKYFTTAVLWALENNITKGRTATTFGPDDACTRGHVVTFLYRAYA